MDKNLNVTETLQFYKDCNKIVTKLVEIRKNDMKVNQQFMAEMIGVSRKRINEFENGKIDIDLMVRYCDKLEVALELKMIIE